MYLIRFHYQPYKNKDSVHGEKFSSNYIELCNSYFTFRLISGIFIGFNINIFKFIEFIILISVSACFYFIFLGTFDFQITHLYYRFIDEIAWYLYLQQLILWEVRNRYKCIHYLSFYRGSMSLSSFM